MLFQVIEIKRSIKDFPILKFCVLRSVIEKPAMSEIALLASRASGKKKTLAGKEAGGAASGSAANRIGDENLTS